MNATEWTKILQKDDNKSSLLDLIIRYRTIPRHHWQNMLGATARRKKITELAFELCEKARVPTDRLLGLNDIPMFEKLLNINIFVVSSRVGDKFIRVVDDKSRTNIYLYHIESENEKHWHGIANIQGFFKADYFCASCLKPFKDKHKHSCESSCEVCLDKNCPTTNHQMCCRSCGRQCRSYQCFLRHKSERKVGKKTYAAECETIYQCKKCKKVMKYEERKPTEHVCDEWKCTVCQKYNVGQHLCYQRGTPLTYDDENDTNKRFAFYDFETRQDGKMQCEWGYSPCQTRCRNCAGKSNRCAKCILCQNCQESSCGMNQHRVNFAVIQTSCKVCENKELTPESRCGICGKRCHKCGKMNKKGEFEKSPCPDTCGFRESIFRGDDAAVQFCSYITQEHQKNFILIAHNAKGFDLYPVLETLIDRHAIRPDKIIYNGSKITYMYVAKKLNLTFLGSSNFLPMKLAKIPGALGLSELSKGFFPHFFNRIENMDYVGPYPASEYYGPDTMSKTERLQFLEWHKAKENDIFNFQEEILKYCRSDVDILRRGCLHFRKLMMDVTGGVDPFDYVTIASVCMGIYKTLFLKEEHEIEIKNLENDVSTWQQIKSDNGINLIYYEDKWIPMDELNVRQELKLGNSRFLKSPIAVVPSAGYVAKDNYSKASIQWLEWIMEDNRRKGKDVQIQHALNGGEFKIPNTNYRCDGYDEKHNTIYEFYGKSIKHSRWRID